MSPMNQLHPIAQTLTVLLDNQRSRTAAAFEGMTDDTFTGTVVGVEGHDCHTIQQIGRHLVGLRGFGLKLLESPLAAQMPPTAAAESPAQCAERIEQASALLAEAIAGYDNDLWLTAPDEPREGLWGDEPTLQRLTRPFNDFINHLGAVRAIRRLQGNAAENTQ